MPSWLSDLLPRKGILGSSDILAIAMKYGTKKEWRTYLDTGNFYTVPSGKVAVLTNVTVFPDGSLQGYVSSGDEINIAVSHGGNLFSGTVDVLVLGKALDIDGDGVLEPTDLRLVAYNLPAIIEEGEGLYFSVGRVLSEAVNNKVSVYIVLYELDKNLL